MNFFFCGIGGIGMSAIAFALKAKGHKVSGSDRSFDKNENMQMRERLEEKGILICPQNGSGVLKETDVVVVSSAVEESIPDIQKAFQYHIPIKKRAEVLADLFNEKKGIAVAGTSGKTTITAMIGHILTELGKSPTMINGGISVNTYTHEKPSNFIQGKSDLYVIESDESDGTIDLYNPFISVVSNISLDHKPLQELYPFFENFIKRTKKGVVLNADCPETQKISFDSKKCVFFSFKNKKADFYISDIQTTEYGSLFKINNKWGFLPVLGKHNIANAAAAVAACSFLSVSLKECLWALSSFRGTQRRMQKKGNSVFDDYAHNPEKIAAAVSSLKSSKNRLFIIFQPHGFTPTKLMKNELIHVFQTIPSKKDFILLPEIFYAGGTVQKSISSKDLAEQISLKRKAFFFEKRKEIIPFILSRFKKGDKVLVMGARDASLSDFSEEIARQLPQKNNTKIPFFCLGKPQKQNVALVMPSSAHAQPVDLNKIQVYFNQKGYGVFISPFFFSHTSFCAGTSEERAFEINTAFSLPYIHLVMAFRGGYGSAQILDKINYSVIKKNPKPFYGFSDTTALQWALLKKANLSSWTGFCPTLDIPKKDFTPPNSWKIQTKNNLSGQLVGGCLSLIVSLIGTPYFPDLKNTLLFIEDVGEEPYKIDRMLTQLEQAGIFSKIKGLIFGHFEKCFARDEKDGTIEQLIDTWQKKLYPLPVMKGLSYGHYSETEILPIGKNVVISTQKQNLSTK